MVDTSNVEYLPIWKAEATAEERLLELAMIARKHPERFAKLMVVYSEALRGKLGPKCEMIREILDAGADVGYRILGEYATDAEACVAEKEFISLHSGLANLTDGGESGFVGDPREIIKMRSRKLLERMASFQDWHRHISHEKELILIKLFGSAYAFYSFMRDSLVRATVNPEPTGFVLGKSGWVPIWET